MTPAVAPSLMTTEELLALPENGMDRWLIRGRLREKPKTFHNRKHSRTMALVGTFLSKWLDQQPEPRGDVFGGEAGVTLRRIPDSTLGVDVVYVSQGVWISRQSEAFPLIDGVPVLAIEILSPNDVVEDVNDKIDEYLSAGVALVWVIDPHHRTVEIFRQGEEPKLVNVREELSGEPELPGFRVRVEQLFQ